ncbi:MAG: DUF4230 domain-containing protein [Phycisphaerales bacterium]
MGESLLLLLLGLVVGAAGVAVFLLLVKKGAKQGPLEIHSVFERVQAVGRLIGLEVSAKEIATTTKGLSWLPPILLSQARIAMIFQFEKQYAIDLHKLRPEQVHKVGERYVVDLPPVEGRLRLVEMVPYDIQAGRVLGLLDVIQMNAQTQKELIERAQSQAAELYESNAPKYEAEARASIERQLRALLEMFEVDVEFVWAEQPQGRERVEVSERIKTGAAV